MSPDTVERTALYAPRAMPGTMGGSLALPRLEPLETTRTSRGEDSHQGGRRALNVAVAVIGIVMTAPLMAVIAVLIKLTSPGPILFTQPRVGVDRRNGSASADGRRTLDYGGRLFRIYKFRTMKVNGDGDQAVWAVENDPRITAIGDVLRKYRLDELPQLFNVLKGDMNVVGPRPEQPRIFRDLSLRVPNYTARQTVMPGITGWAQVNRGYDDSVKAVREKLRFDLEYVERQSLAMDVQIMLRTLPVIAFRRGAR